MSNLRLLSLIAVLVIINFESISAFKCRFQIKRGEEEYNIPDEYYCKVITDPNFEEYHLPEKTDNDVKFVWLENGKGVTHFTQSDFPYCHRFPNLYKVDKRGLKSIDGNAYEICKNVNTINIEKGNVEEVPENLISDNSLLTRLEISNNKITTLSENFFSNNKELETLQLEDNQIITFPANLFKPLTKLKYLWLEDNKIQTLNPAWFEPLEKLKILKLSENKITDLPANVFVPLVSLEKLYLDNNKITVIHLDSFRANQRFKRIEIEDNKITAIDEKFLDAVSIEEFMFDDNVCIKKFPYNRLITIKQSLNKCFENYQPRE